MKLIVTRKKEAPKGDSLANTLNSGIGSTFRFMPDNEVEDYVANQAMRGYVCFEFDHTGTYESQTTITRTAA